MEVGSLDGVDTGARKHRDVDVAQWRGMPSGERAMEVGRCDRGLLRELSSQTLRQRGRFRHHDAMMAHELQVALGR